MGFHLNNSVKDQGLVRVMGGNRSCSQPFFWFVGMTCSVAGIKTLGLHYSHQGIGDCAVLL